MLEVKFLDKVSILDALLAEEKKQVRSACSIMCRFKHREKRWKTNGDTRKRRKNKEKHAKSHQNAIERPCAQVANALVEMHFAAEDRIIQQGEPGNMRLGVLAFRRALI